MNSKTIVFGLIAVCFAFTAASQKIVVDSSSTNKYIIKPVAPKEEKPKNEELSFSDRALSIGAGILNRLKARLNLEEASESLKAKKEKILGKKESDEKKEEEKKEPEVKRENDDGS
ncbi:MAG: hypothetical protein RIM99_01975 [Cyclobacteriaceae bacterium]